MSTVFQKAKEAFVRGCIIAVMIAIGLVPVLGVLKLFELIVNALI